MRTRSVSSLKLYLAFALLPTLPGLGSAHASEATVSQEEKSDKETDEKAAKRAERKKQREAKKQAEQPAVDPATAAMLEAGEPGEAHARLAPLVGSFDVATVFWAAPGVPPEKSKGTSTSKWVLGKRFVVEDFRGSFMGMKFQGMGMLGYDKTDGRYLSTWADSMSTTVMVSYGKMDPAGKALTMEGSVKEPGTKELKTYRLVTTFEGPDRHSTVMYVLQDGAEPFKFMELAYTRKAPKPGKEKPATEKAAKEKAVKKQAAESESK